MRKMGDKIRKLFNGFISPLKQRVYKTDNDPLKNKWIDKSSFSYSTISSTPFSIWFVNIKFKKVTQHSLVK